MNLIEKAAEALYPVRPKYAFNGKTISKDVNESRRRICIEDITHFLSYLSQQGDEEIIKALYVTHIANNDYRYYSEDITNAMMEALAIGRASNRWIPVSERLPDFDSLSDVEKITGVRVIAAWGSNASNVAEMRYVERTVRGKQVRRFEWQGRISPWEIIYWQPLPEPPKI